MKNGFLIDIDGTLLEDWRFIPGADKWLSALRKNNIPFLLLTNSTIRSRAEIIASFADGGVGVTTDDILNPESAAFAYLQAHHPGSKLRLLTDRREMPWEKFTLVDEEPDVILLGDIGDRFTRDLIDQLMNQILSGAKLIALHKSRFWRQDGKLKADLGGFVAMLEYVTGTEAVTIGKPSPEFFNAGASMLGLDNKAITMIGDDLNSDVIAAMATGMKGILVRTGKYIRDFDHIAGAEKIPVFDNISQIII